MKAALYRIFKKNLLIVLALLLLLAGYKYLTARDALQRYGRLEYLDGWLTDCAELADSQLEDYIRNLKIPDPKTEPELYDRVMQNYNRLNDTAQNRKAWQKLIAFAAAKEGVLPVETKPEHYMDMLDYYGQLEAPPLINEQPLDLYYALQANDIVPVLVVLLIAIFWGMHYEAEISKYTKTTRHGQRYDRTLHRTLILLSLGLLAVNEVFDLAFSGLLSRLELWNQTIQSYTGFRRTECCGTIGWVLLLPMVSKVMNVLILCLAAEWLARWKRTLKETIIAVFLLLLALLFLGKALPIPYSTMLHIGVVRWNSIPYGTRFLLPTTLSSLPVGVGFTTLVGGILCTISIRQKIGKPGLTRFKKQQKKFL